MAEQKSTNVISWSASEYIEHQRGASWYFLLLIGTALLAAVIYLLTKDYFAIGVIVILGIIVGSTAHRKPAEVKYELSSDGLRAGEKFYSFTQFKTFAILREGSLNSLVLDPLKKLMPPISVYFEAEDEEAIIDIVGDHLPMADRSPDRIDRLTRRLRF